MNRPIIDVNVNLSRWPTRKLAEDEVEKLVAKLREHSIETAWVSSFDGILHKDIDGVNSRLADQCKSANGVKLVPFGVINPMLPDWRDDLERCAVKYEMPGIRLFPNYHNYQLDNAEFVNLFLLATQRRMIVTIAVQMEDERMMHPLLRVRPVDIARLESAIVQASSANVVLLNLGNSMLRNEQLSKMMRSGKVSVDIAFLDGLQILSEGLEKLPLDRILFGSNAPLFYVEAALLKLPESGLANLPSRAILFENASTIMSQR